MSFFLGTCVDPPSEWHESSPCFLAPTSRSILILFSHLGWDLRSVHFLHVLLPKPVMPLVFPMLGHLISSTFINAGDRLYCNHRQFLVCKHTFPLPMQLRDYCSGIPEPSVSVCQSTRCYVAEDFSHQQSLCLKSNNFAQMLFLLTSMGKCRVRIVAWPPNTLRGFPYFPSVSQKP